MNQAQHIWLAIMTELAMGRCRHSRALSLQWFKHIKLGGIDNRIVQTGDGRMYWWIRPK